MLQVIVTKHLCVQCAMRVPSTRMDFNLPPAPAVYSLTPLLMLEDSRGLSPGPHLQTTGP